MDIFTEQAHLCRLHLNGFPIENFDIRGTPLTLRLERFPKPLRLQDSYMAIIETMSICRYFRLANLHQECLLQPIHLESLAFHPSQAQKLTPHSSIAAVRIAQAGDPKFISNYKWIHGNVMLWIEAQQYGPDLTWIKLVQIMQGMASFCEQRGFWASIIDVMEDESHQIGRVSFWTSK